MYTDEDDSQPLGTIKEILQPGANDVWVVKPAKGQDILIPVINDVVLDVDIQAKKITVHLMEGLLP
ncbi:Ribosome maturation factor RimM [compost metagenome]